MQEQETVGTGDCRNRRQQEGMKGKGMGFTVEALLNLEQMSQAQLISGMVGITKDIKGVTIIEAPDIVKFLSGGELLLTGLYAFQSCTLEEFQAYMVELPKKQVSGIIYKQGRQIEDMEHKVLWLKQFTEENEIPLIEIPFDLSFQVILALVLGRLFHEDKIFVVSELERKIHRDILYHLLHDSIHSAEEIKKSAELLRLSLKAYYRCIVFEVQGPEPDMAEFLMQIEHRNLWNHLMRHQEAEYRNFWESGKMILVWNEKEQAAQKEYRQRIQSFLDQVQAEIRRQFPRLSIQAGAGKVVQGVGKLSETYRQACDALLFGEIMGDTRKEAAEDAGAKLTMFSDMGVFKLLAQIQDSEVLKEYIPESLVRLYEYKNPLQENLITTLKSYLDHNQNLSKTAKDLFIHYKTAAYRIEKIVAISGIDFDNVNEILAVRIGLVVHNMLEKNLCSQRPDQ